jgi:hypothetical protein
MRVGTGRLSVGVSQKNREEPTHPRLMSTLKHVELYYHARYVTFTAGVHLSRILMARATKFYTVVPDFSKIFAVFHSKPECVSAHIDRGESAR